MNRTALTRAGPESGQNNPARWLFFALGLVFVALGFVGAFLPILPTVPFLILAAACFSRSSRRMELWLLGHPMFGPMLRDWQARGAIPKKAKIAALGGIATGLVLFVVLASPSWPILFAVLALCGVGLGYIFTRPTG